MTRVLIVEDTPLNLELISEILESQGFEIDKAVDGEEAIKKAENRKFDLILMDIALPGIDGIETARIIKSKTKNKDAPVIALTAFAMKGDKEKLLRGGFADYIPKPIDVPEFIKKIRNIVKQHEQT